MQPGLRLAQEVCMVAHAGGDKAERLLHALNIILFDSPFAVVRNPSARGTAFPVVYSASFV